MNRLLFVAYTVLAFLFSWAVGWHVAHPSWKLAVEAMILAGLVWGWFDLRKRLREEE
jgi:hypothetical protein